MVRFVYMELASEEPLMQVRACQMYGVFAKIPFNSLVFADMKYEDNNANDDINRVNHLDEIVRGFRINMEDHQPLPLKYQAAIALKDIL